MPRYIDAEVMPSGYLWEELTDKEKLNVINYLLSRPSVDIIRTVFEEVAGIMIESKSEQGVVWTTKEAFESLLEKYNIEDGIEI